MRRTIAVTGGARGIGEAIGLRAAEDGYSVAIVDMDGDAAELAATTIAGKGGYARAISADVRDESSLQAAFEVVESEFGRLDVLVNNAGTLGGGPTTDTDFDRVMGMLDVHVGGTLRTSRCAFPFLRQTNGSAIVNISSVNAAVGTPNLAGYSSSKGAIESLTRTLAIEWAPVGIRVNAVAPGYVEPPPSTLASRPRLSSPAIVSSRIPMGRWAEPSEIASVVCFLASADASYITGQIIVVDGGMTIDGDYERAALAEHDL